MDEAEKTRRDNIQENLPEILKEAGVPVSGKKVIDVGAQYCYHAEAMKAAGAKEVWALDLFPEPTSDSSISQENIVQEKVEEAPDHLLENFDVLTVFRAAPRGPNRSKIDAFYYAARKLLKPDGTMLIALDKDKESTQTVLKKLFKNVTHYEVTSLTDDPDANVLAIDNKDIFVVSGLKELGIWENLLFLWKVRSNIQNEQAFEK